MSCHTVIATITAASSVATLTARSAVATASARSAIDVCVPTALPVVEPGGLYPGASTFPSLSTFPGVAA